MGYDIDNLNSIYAPLIESLTKIYLKLNELGYDEALRRFDAALEENVVKVEGDASVVTAMTRMTNEGRFAAAIHFNRPIGECINEIDRVGDQCLRDAMIYMTMIIVLARCAAKQGCSDDVRYLIDHCDGFIQSINDLGLKIKELQSLKS